MAHTLPERLRVRCHRLGQWCVLRHESLTEGKWDHLQPKTVEIPCFTEYTGVIWYHCPEEGVLAVVLRDGEREATFMLTRPGVTTSR